jgi:hypothetical protein
MPRCADPNVPRPHSSETAQHGRPCEVELAAGKDTITNAPRIDPDGELSEAEEEQLFSYYGLGYSQRRSPAGLPETGDLARRRRQRAVRRRGL